MPSDDTINTNLFNTTITLTSGSEIVIRNSGKLSISLQGTIIDGGAGQNRIFYSDGANVSLSFMKLQGGDGAGANFSGHGGAIYVFGGTMTLNFVTVRDNRSIVPGTNNGSGGGIAFNGGTNHRIDNSTVANNSSLGCGAGFTNVGGTLFVGNSTISGNSTSNSGGGFCNSNGTTTNGTTTLRNTTVVTLNTAPNGRAGGFAISGGTVNLGNTIVAGNSAVVHPEIWLLSGTITSAGDNLIGDSAGDSTDTENPIAYQSSDIRDQNPQLGALQNNGGLTLTHALLPGSPAIDAGNNSLAVDPSNNLVPPFDQRGTSPFQRIRNGTVDIGAFEYAPPATFTVNDTGDAGDAGTADNICATSTNVCTLRAAVQQANATAGNDTINFAIPAGDAGCTAGGVCTITLTNGELFIPSNSSAPGTLTITNATGASNLLISGNNASRVFLVSSANLTLNGVTITNGNGTGTTSTPFNGFGGGIAQLGGTLTLNNSRVSGNSSASRGGGIYSQSGAAVTLTNSTVSGNTSVNGGGINPESGSTLTLTNSTVSGNMTPGSGGGIFSNNDNTITLTNSTVSGNTSGNGGSGIFLNFGGTLNLTGVTVTNNRSTSTTCTTCAGGISNGSGTVNLNNTIVAGNTAANASASPDFRGAISATSSFNIIGNNQGTTGITNGTNGNQVGTPANPIDPRLEPLANNGGTTQTHALRSDSPAIDKGSSFGLTTDQRGLTRPVDLANYTNAADGADIGAFEVQNTVVAAGFEADIAPRPNGDGMIQSNDVVQIRRFANNTDTPSTNPNEFQRADSAPFNTKGDGCIRSNDVVQTRLYANQPPGTAPQPASGPTTPGNCTPPPPTSAAEEQSADDAPQAVAPPRVLTVQSTSGSAGSQVTVNILVDAVGDESVFDFDLTFDPMVLSNPVVGPGNAGAAIRDCQTATAGQVNCVIEGFPMNNPMSSNSLTEIGAGDNQILITVTFTIAANAQPGSTTPLTILDGSNASNDSGTLFQLEEENGTVTITGTTAAETTISGRIRNAAGVGLRRVSMLLQNTQSGETQITRTGPDGSYKFENLSVGVDYILTPRLARHTFSPASKQVSLTEELTEIDFTAESQKGRR